MSAIWSWIVSNAAVLFSGVGVAVVGAILRFGYRRWLEYRTGAVEVQKELHHARVTRRSFQSRLPRVLLRVLYKPSDIESQVVIKLRDDAPGSINLGNPIPYVDLYFQITNLSPIDLVLDRALVDVWFGQPAFTAALLHRYRVPAGEITTGIHVRQMISDNQKAYIADFEAAPRGSRGRFHVYITAYFDSKLGRFFVQSSIERDRL